MERGVFVVCFHSWGRLCLFASLCSRLLSSRFLSLKCSILLHGMDKCLVCAGHRSSKAACIATPKYLSQYIQCDELSHSRVQWVDSSVPLANAENPVTSAWISCLLPSSFVTFANRDRRDSESDRRQSHCPTASNAGDTCGSSIEELETRTEPSISGAYGAPSVHKKQNSLLCLPKTISAQASCFGS